MTKRQREVLERQNTETLCRWHTLINSWLWPEGLPDDPYRGLPPDERSRVELHNSSPFGKMGVFLFWIEDRVGKKEVLRHWNTVERKVGRMTEAEFEKWWKEKGKEADEWRAAIPSQLRIATISAMSERLARECASETWPDEKIVSSKKKSRNLYTVVLSKKAMP